MNVHALPNKATAGPSKIGADALADPSAPVAISFTMPMPPSTNHLFKNVKGVGRVKTKAYDDFTVMAIAAIRRQGVGVIQGRVIAVWGVERFSDQADISNRLKAAEDAIVKAGVITDDKFVTAHFITWLPPANGLAHVQLLPIQRLTLEFYPSQSGTSGAIVVHVPSTEEEGNEDYGDIAI